MEEKFCSTYFLKKSHFLTSLSSYNTQSCYSLSSSSSKQVVRTYIGGSTMMVVVRWWSPFSLLPVPSLYSSQFQGLSSTKSTTRKKASHFAKIIYWGFLFLKIWQIFWSISLELFRQTHFLKFLGVQELLLSCIWEIFIICFVAL